MRKLVILAVLAATLVLPAPAQAHDLTCQTHRADYINVTRVDNYPGRTICTNRQRNRIVLWWCYWRKARIACAYQVVEKLRENPTVLMVSGVRWIR